MPNGKGLPLRLKEAIAIQQYRSELLVGGVQLGVIGLFFIVNVFIPENYSPNTPVHSTSLGLLLFSILVLVRLWFAYTDQLTPIFLGFSIIAEMVLLLFIIWTYYIQYETSPTINLKNTHIDYAFILISLRALRFEPKWVILSGLTAAVGWSIIVWQTIISAGTNVITWDYVTYASSDRVYLGAIFDVVLSILCVTFIIALVLYRAKRTLYQAVEQTTAAKDLARFFDTGVAEKITHAEAILEAGFGEIRQTAIMFTDLRGFTKLSKTLPPNELITLLGQYQQLLVPIIQKHNGNIDKFLGDGMMVSFGAVTPSTTYAADALRAVDEIKIALNAWNEKRHLQKERLLDVGIGLAAGEVIFGVIGNADRLEYTVIGETANLAAKLEKQNKVEHTQALTTTSTLTLGIKQNYDNPIQRTELRARHVSGVSGTVDLIVLS